LCAPTAENGPGTLVRQTQAQKGDRTKSRFCEHRAPVGPEKPHPSTPDFARRKCSAPFRRVSLVMGTGGKANMSASALILSRPPAILWFLSHRWERNSPPGTGCVRRKTYLWRRN